MAHRYLGTKDFYGRAIRIAVPVMAQLLIQNLVSLVDNFMVAGLGDIKMGGVNVANQINFIFLVLMNTLCASGGIYMSQYKGAGDKEGMKQALRFKVIVAGLFGIAYSVLGFLAPRGLFAQMVHSNTDAAAILDQAQMYSRSLAMAWFFMVFAQALASSLREIEMVKAPLVISSIATLINTFFNWVLIYGNLGAPRLEVAGAGYATVIARGAELLMFLGYCVYKRPPFMFNPLRLFKIDFNLFRSIFGKSLMILYSEMFWAVSETISNALYNTRGGAEIVSGMAAGFAVANLFFICFSGIFTSTGVIIGQELGAGKLEECRKYKNWVLTGSTIFGIGFMLVGLVSTVLVPVVFGNLTPEARKIAVQLIACCAIYLPLWAYINAQFAISRTGGDTTMGVICDSVSNVLFIGGMFLLTFLTNFGPILMYAIVKLSDGVKALIAYFWLKKERWLVNLTER